MGKLASWIAMSHLKQAEAAEILHVTRLRVSDAATLAMVVKAEQACRPEREVKKSGQAREIKVAKRLALEWRK